MSTSRPSPERAKPGFTRQTLGRRQFLGVAAAALAGAGGIALIGSSGSAHDDHDHGGTPEATPAASPVANAAVTTTFTLSTMDIRFEPDTLTIPATTTVTIVVTNDGVMPHDFVVPGLNVNSGRIDSGASVSIEVKAKAGSYPFYCSVPGHMNAGMRGMLTAE